MKSCNPKAPITINLLLLIAISCFIYSPVKAQKPENTNVTGLDVGLNFGFYIPNNYNAGFYDGSDANDNKISYVLGNTYWRNEINNLLNISDTFIIAEMPLNMKYTPTYTMGIYFRKTYDNYLGFSASFNYSKLVANDVLVLEVDPNQILTQPDYRYINIWGIEDRMNMDFNISKYFPIKNKMFVPFVEAGLNINSTKVKENKIKVVNSDYSLVNIYLNQAYTPGVQLNEYVINQGGIGFGVNLGGGVRMIFNEKISIDPGFTIYQSRINLDGYKGFRPSAVFFVRLSLTGFLLSGGEEEI